MPKLTARQKVAQQQKEKEMKYIRQQNSVLIMSQPSERAIVSNLEDEMYKEMVGEKKANNGLHLAAEHTVITRDMPDPSKIGAMARKKNTSKSPEKEEKEPQAWEVLTDEQQSLPKPDTPLVQKKDLVKQDLSRKSSASKQKANIDKFAIKEFTGAKSSRSDLKGAQSNGVWSEHQQIDITNYQQSQQVVTENQKKEAVFKRIQNSMISKERKTRKNQDLEISKDSSQANVALKNEKQSVGFTDQLSGISNINKTQTTLTGKKVSGGILKQQLLHNTQRIGSESMNAKGKPQFNTINYENRTAEDQSQKDGIINIQVKTNSVEGNSNANVKITKQVSDIDSFMDIDAHNSGHRSHHKHKKGKKEEDRWWEEDNGPQNSHWAGLTSLPGSGVALGGLGFKPGDNSLPNQEIDDVITRNKVVMGVIPARRKGKLCWQNVSQSQYVMDKQQQIETTMLEMVYQYTRKDKQRLQQYQSITQSDDQDFFQNGLTNAQDIKANKMRRKLNQSVDFAEIKEREMERQKQKYIEHPIYKQVSDKMDFNNDEYLSNMNKATDPKYSPLTPAAYAQQKEELIDVSKEEQKIDVYDTSIPSLEKFTGDINLFDQQMEDRFATVRYKKAATTFDRPLKRKESYKEKAIRKTTINEKKQKKAFDQNDIIPERSEESPSLKPKSEENIVESKSESGRQKSRSKTTQQNSSTNEEEEEDDNYDADMFENPLDDQIDVQEDESPNNQTFTYDIRNKPKKQQSAMEKLANDIDQPKGPKETWQDNRLQMLETERVFKIIHEYCSDNLSVGYNLLDKHIEELLKPHVDVSPLLKFYNLLAKETYFRLPSKALLEYDQKFYRSFINRLREAQKVEVKWVKNTIINESRKTCITAFDQARELMQTELKEILYLFDGLKEQLEEQKQQNIKLKKIIEGQQLEISEQKVFLKQTICKLFEDDEELFYLNEGPGGAHDKFIYGDVIQNIDQYNSLLKDQCLAQADELKEKLESKIMEELQSSLMPQSNISAVSNQFQRKLTIGPRDPGGSSSGSASPSKKLGTSFKSQVQSAINSVSIIDLIPPKKDMVVSLEPFMKNPFQLFGGYVKLTMQDAQSCMDQEIYKYHKMKIKKQKQANDEIQAENFASAVMMEELRKRNDMLQAENDRFHEKLNEMRKEFAQETAKIKFEADNNMKEVQERTRAQMNRARKLMAHEVHICTAIKDKMLNENMQMAAKLKKFATIIRIPRLHFDYIEKYGVNEFVTYCEDIVRRERALLDLKKAEKQKIDLRQQAAIQSIKKINGSMEQKIKDQKFDMKVNVPFKLDVSAQKDMQEDSRITAKDKENQQILNTLKEINWIKNQSILNLTELIEKNIDRQPQLLTMLQPDLKSHLLNNPALLKTIEQLEKSDPINKKTKEMKKFLEKIKSETFGSFKDDSLQRANTYDMIEFKKNLSKSITFDKFEDLDQNKKLQKSKKEIKNRSKSNQNSNESTSDQGNTIIVQVNSNNDESSKRLLQSISGSNQQTKAPSIMFGMNHSELDTRIERNEDFKELKDKVSGLDNIIPSLMTRVSTNINEIKKQPFHTINDINEYARMDQRNALSSKIVGLNQLNRIQRAKHNRYESRFNHSPNPHDLLNNQSSSRLSLGQNPVINSNNKTSAKQGTKWADSNYQTQTNTNSQDIKTQNLLSHQLSIGSSVNKKIEEEPSKAQSPNESDNEK